MAIDDILQDSQIDALEKAFKKRQWENRLDTALDVIDSFYVDGKALAYNYDQIKRLHEVIKGLEKKENSRYLTEILSGKHELGIENRSTKLRNKIDTLKTKFNQYLDDGEAAKTAQVAKLAEYVNANTNDEAGARGVPYVAGGTVMKPWCTGNTQTEDTEIRPRSLEHPIPRPEEPAEIPLATASAQSEVPTNTQLAERLKNEAAGRAAPVVKTETWTKFPSIGYTGIGDEENSGNPVTIASAVQEEPTYTKLTQKEIDEGFIEAGNGRANRPSFFSRLSEKYKSATHQVSERLSNNHVSRGIKSVLSRMKDASESALANIKDAYQTRFSDDYLRVKISVHRDVGTGNAFRQIAGKPKTERSDTFQNWGQDTFNRLYTPGGRSVVVMGDRTNHTTSVVYAANPRRMRQAAFAR